MMSAAITKMYPAKQHAAKVVEQLNKLCKAPSLALLYLEGEVTRARHDTDRYLPFRQESNFFYLTGCTIPASKLLIESRNGKINSTLYVPPVNPAEVMWMGLPASLKVVKETHNVDEVKTTDDLSSHLQELLKQEDVTLFHFKDVKTPVEIAKTETSNLLDAIQEARIVKTDFEIELMRHANKLSSAAHEKLMKATASGKVKREDEGAAFFEYECKRYGSKGLAYESIVAYGPSSSTLHYVKNDQPFVNADRGHLLLVDAGCEWQYYAADITRTYPIGNQGKFTEEGRNIYELVLAMQETSMSRMKPGVSWEEIHLHCHRMIIRGLLKIGILIAGPLKETGKALEDKLYDMDLSIPFFPHGLGHQLGLDVHDLPNKSSRPDGPSKNPKSKYLRYLRPLYEGMVITCEPGCYFNKYLLDPVKDSPHINHDLLQKYLKEGGVRIEDDILITKDGIENLTTAVKSVADIESQCKPPSNA